MYTSLAPFVEQMNAAENVAATTDNLAIWFPPGDATDKLKQVFAEAYGRNSNNAYLAAKAVTVDPTKAQAIALAWPVDDLVIKHMEAVAVKHGARSKLPTKEEFAHQILEDAKAVRSSEIKLKYLALFSDVMGFVPKTAAAMIQNNTSVTVNKVMRVPYAEDRATVEAVMVKQQLKLVKDAANAAAA